MAEKILGTKFDLTLFEFYELGETNTPFGILKMANKKKKPPNKSFPYNLSFFPGTNVVFGVAFPRMTAVFWATLMVIMLRNHQASLWVIVPVTAVMILMFLMSLRRPATPEDMLDEHILAQYAQENRGS
jgi:hypothetical protein